MLALERRPPAEIDPSPPLEGQAARHAHHLPSAAIAPEG